MSHKIGLDVATVKRMKFESYPTAINHFLTIIFQTSLTFLGTNGRSFLLLATIIFSTATYATLQTQMIFRLSKDITVTVRIEEIEGKPVINWILNDEREGGIRNWAFDSFELSHKEKLLGFELVRPDFITEIPDPAIQFQDSGDLVRNLKREGIFAVNIEYITDYKDAKPKYITILHPIKKILAQQLSYRHSVTGFRKPPEGTRRYISIRDMKDGENELTLMNIADVNPNGDYRYMTLRSNSGSTPFYEVEGQYLDLYSMPNRWHESNKKIYFGGTEIFEITKTYSHTYLDSWMMQLGHGKFTGFNYSVSNLGTRNFVTDLDKIVSKPTRIKFLGSDGNYKYLPVTHDEFRPPQNTSSVYVTEDLTFNDLMERHNPPPISLKPEFKDHYLRLWNRLHVTIRMNCKDLFGK